MTKVRTVSGADAYTVTEAAEEPRGNGGKVLKILIGLVFVFYIFCVLYLVFFERLLHGSTSAFHKPAPDMDYISQLRRYLQIVPLRTIRIYINSLQSDNPLRRIAFVNLAGNLILFLPMGFFLPYFWPKQRKPFWFVLTMTTMIAFVEITQLLTLLGTCDIDDLILNLIGALGGFVIFYILHFLGRRIFYGRNKA